MNLFATVLTYPAPSANYRGESELNRTVIQKVTDGRFDYPIISPEAMRNALREILAGYKLPCNRERLPDEEQLAVHFRDLPNPDSYVDDFFFGYLVAAGSKERKEYLKQIKDDRGEEALKSFVFKRDSVLRMNLAKALEPYRHNAVFTQSPLAGKVGDKESAYKNADTSALLHRETCVSAFQYPFALAGNDCKVKPEWTKKLLQAIGELNDVAGNHARSYFEMAPASIIVRLTNSLVAGYRTYCFRSNGLPDLIDDILNGDFAEIDNGNTGAGFYLAGELVKRDLPKDVQDKLNKRGVTLERDPRKLLEVVAEKFVGGA
jgi:CRISPR-associated protein Cst2